MKDCDCKTIAEALRPLVPGRARPWASRELVSSAETSHRVLINLPRGPETKAWAITLQQWPTITGDDDALVFVAVNSPFTPTEALTELAAGRGLFISAEGSKVEAAPAGIKSLTLDLVALSAVDGSTRKDATVSIEVREMVSADATCNC